MTTRTIVNRLGELDWGSDLTLELPYRADPWRERAVVSGSNFTLRGLLGPNGERPVISAVDAVTDKQFLLPANDGGLNGAAPLLIWKTLASGDVTPTNILIENIIFEGAYPGAFFTDAQGNRLPWTVFSAGLYGYRGVNVTFRNCWFRDNAGGLLCTNGGLSNVLVQGCRFSGNAVVGTDQCHGSYMECIGITYDGCVYDKNRPGSGGCSLKDRSANSVVQNCIVHQNSTAIQFDNFDNEPVFAGGDTGAIARNNVLLFDNDPGNYPGIITYAPNRGVGVSPGFFNNTFVIRCDAEKMAYIWPILGLYLDRSTRLRISGSLIDSQRATPGVYSPDIRLYDAVGTYVFGPNWVRPKYATIYTRTPSVEGLEQVVQDARPAGFKDEANGDYSLVDGAAAAGFGASVVTPLPPPVVPPMPPSPPPLPPPPPAKVWTEIARQELDPVIEELVPGVRSRVESTKFIEQEK